MNDCNVVSHPSTENSQRAEYAKKYLEELNPLIEEYELKVDELRQNSSANEPNFVELVNYWEDFIVKLRKSSKTIISEISTISKNLEVDIEKEEKELLALYGKMSDKFVTNSELYEEEMKGLRQKKSNLLAEVVVFEGEFNCLLEENALIKLNAKTAEEKLNCDKEFLEAAKINIREVQEEFDTVATLINNEYNQEKIDEELKEVALMKEHTMQNIAEYKRDISKAEKETEQLHSDLNTMIVEFTEKRETEKMQLDEEKQLMEEVAALKENIKRQREQMEWNNKIKQREQEEAALFQEIANTKRKIEEVNKECEQIKNQFDDLENKKCDILTLKNLAEKESITLHRVLEKLSSEKIDWENKLKEADEELIMLRQSRATEESRVEKSVETRKEQLEKEESDLLKQIEEFDRWELEQKEKFKTLEEGGKGFEKDIGELNSAIDIQNKELEKLHSRMEKVEFARKQYQSSIDQYYAKNNPNYEEDTSDASQF